MTLTQDQVQIIRSTVPVLKDHGNEITTSFYHTLLQENPELNNVFNQANQANNHQAAALAGSLYAYASHIDDLGALSPAVEKISQKHASLYIKPKQYEVVGTYLLRAMGEVLGDALTKETHDAWAEAYWQLANIMIKKEDEILSHGDGWKDWRDMRITEKVKESEEITSFYLEPTDGQALPPFLPGQYISVMTEVPRLKHLQSRQYSLSDAPKREYYRISIKRERGLNTSKSGAKDHPGYISNIMHEHKKVGDVLKVSHPAGEFYLDPEKEANLPVVLISAGVGLTPMMSIMNTLLDRESKQPISWVHTARSSSVQAFAQHMRDVVKQNANVQAFIFIKSPTEKDVEGVDYHLTGRLRLEELRKREHLFLDDKRAEYFVCGPDRFMSDVAKGLQEYGVDDGRIKMEVFGTGKIPS